MARPLADLHVIGDIYGRKAVRRRKLQPEFLDGGFGAPASGNAMSTSREFVEHGAAEATGHAGDYDAFH
jgi:hypothetical protein